MKLSEMDEFSLIKHYFQQEQAVDPNVVVGSGDDCAVLSLSPYKELLVTTDTLVCGTHFLEDFPVEAIIHRALMANVSDIAAMGGQARWLSLSLTMPSFDRLWLSRLSRHLYAELSTLNIQLIGGDLARGPLSVTMTLQGECEKGQALTRDGAKEGDLIFVSNQLGEVAFALKALNEQTPDYQSSIFHKFLYPTAQTALASLLPTFASACIDVSDGLSQDLAHILKASGVGAILEQAALPISPMIEEVLTKEEASDLALSSGEEFELCFTLPAQSEESFLNVTRARGLSVSKIGVITCEQEYLIQEYEGRVRPLSIRGFKHF